MMSQFLSQEKNLQDQWIINYPKGDQLSRPQSRGSTPMTTMHSSKRNQKSRQKTYDNFNFNQVIPHLTISEQTSHSKLGFHRKILSTGTLASFIKPGFNLKNFQLESQRTSNLNSLKQNAKVNSHLPRASQSNFRRSHDLKKSQQKLDGQNHNHHINLGKMLGMSIHNQNQFQRNTLLTQRPQTQHQFNGVIKLLEDRNLELKRDEKLIDIIESSHQQNEQQQTSMKQDSLVKKRKYNDDNSLETSLTKSLGSSPKSKIVHFDKQQLIKSLNNQRGLETSESKQFSKVKFIKAQDDTDTSKDQEMLRINIPLNCKEDLDYKERVETKPFREFGIDLDNTERQRQLQTMREDSVKSSMKRTRIELYYNKDQYGRKSVRNRSTAQQKQRLKRTKSPVLKEISIEKKESQQDLKVSKEQIFSYMEKENQKFKMKQYPMKYRPLSLKEQRFEGPLIYFKSQKQHSSRNQKEDEATLEAFKVKNLLKVQLQDKMKQVQDLHLNHNHLKEFQNIVQKVLIDKREAFYNQVREIEKKKNPYISQIYMNAIKNNNIDEIYKLLCKDQALLFIADYSQKTGMHWAAQRNYCEMIQLLYKFGADLNAKDCDHRTPIYLAAKNDHIEAVKILLGLNADPFIKCLKKLGPEDVTDDDTLKTLLQITLYFIILITKEQDVLDYLKLVYETKTSSSLYKPGN